MARRLALLAVAVLLAGCADEASTAGNGEGDATCPGHSDQTDLPYVDDGGPEQQLDLYFPSDAGCGPVPLVVWVHGGGWRIGDKGNAMDAKVRQWTDAGWAVASVNYRLTDVGAPAADRVMAPSQNEDVAAALALAPCRERRPRHRPRPHRAGRALGRRGHRRGGHRRPDLPRRARPRPVDHRLRGAARHGGVRHRTRSSTAAAPQRRSTGPCSVTTRRPGMRSPRCTTSGMPRCPTCSWCGAARPPGGRRSMPSPTPPSTRAPTVTVVDLPGFSHEDVNKRIGDPTDDVLTPSLQLFLEDCLA